MTAVTGSPPAPGSWREENRRDRAAAAALGLQRDAARAELRITERRAAAQTRREQLQARNAARAQARRARAARRAARMAWLSGHTVSLLFVPVIAVPAVLAWTAMAAYGRQLYGPAGLALPAFSEGAMWAFAAATTVTRHRHPQRPVWHLRAGTAVFAAFGAALNFAHGLADYGAAAGVVMALVSAAGVIAHQLVTAGPRRSRAERDTARITRAIARRERAARRAAIRQAPVELDGEGRARLIFEPATIPGRARAAPAAAPRPARGGPGCRACCPLCRRPGRRARCRAWPGPAGQAPAASACPPRRRPPRPPIWPRRARGRPSRPEDDTARRAGNRRDGRRPFRRRHSPRPDAVRQADPRQFSLGDETAARLLAEVEARAGPQPLAVVQAARSARSAGHRETDRQPGDGPSDAAGPPSPDTGSAYPLVLTLPHG